MAVLKMIGPIHVCNGSRGAYAHLDNAIRYALKPEKTADGLYTGSENCLCETALSEMVSTKKHYGKEPKSRKDRIGYHFVLSWKPEEQITAETALEITKQFCLAYLPGYEAVYGVHLDEKHMHAHIVFNSVSFLTGKKFRYKDGEWERIQQPLLDRLCREHGLHTLTEDTGKTFEEYRQERGQRRRGRVTNGRARRRHTDPSYREVRCDREERCSRVEGDSWKERGYSISDYIREDIDALILTCTDYEGFERGMEEKGYLLRYGDSERYGIYLAVKNKEMKKFRRTCTLGPFYTVDMIKSRIAARHAPLSEEETEDAFLLAGRFYRVRIRYRTDNPYLRRQYARLYRLGVLKKGAKRPSYRETKNRLAEIRRLEYQLLMLAERDYREPAEIEADLAGQKETVAGLIEERKKQRLSVRAYEKMLRVFEAAEGLEGAFLLYQEGNPLFAEEARRYLQCCGQAFL